MLALIFTSCGQKLKSSYSNLHINRHELIAVSYVNRDLSSYNLRTKIQKTVSNLSRGTDTARGVVLLEDTNELAVALDGRDRVIAISPIDGSTRDLIVDGQLNGVIRSITQLDDGDILVIETSNIERFSKEGLRRTAGWPISLPSGTQIRDLRDNSGDFIACAGGTTDQARIYDIDGNQLHATSGPPGHDARGCEQLLDGRLVVAWAGAADQLIVYDSDFSNPQVIVSNLDIGIMPNPNSIAISREGNILVADTSRNNVIEFDTNGNFIQSFGSFSNSQDIYIVP